jgi:hypothetical protein
MRYYRFYCHNCDCFRLSPCKCQLADGAERKLDQFTPAGELVQPVAEV